VLRRRTFPGEAQLGQLGAELVGIGKQPPVPIAGCIGAVVFLKSPEFVALHLVRVEGCPLVGQQQIHRLVELACEVKLPLGVRAPRLTGRSL
jgi:hypothetical protein